MKLSNKILTTFISLLSITIFFQAKAETKKYKCEIDFSFGSYHIQHKKQLEQCIRQVPVDEKVKFIHLLSSANEIGDFKFNAILSRKRLDEIRSFLSQQPERFKNVTKEEVSVGKNSQLGKKGYILIATKKIVKPEVKIVEKIVYVTKEKLIAAPKKQISDYQFFVSSRIARDIFMKDEIAPYFSYGVLGGINIQKQEHIKYELGISANQLVNDNVYTINNAYGLAGAYLITDKHEGFFIGLRGLSGVVANQKQQIDFDGGGEARIGYETKSFTVGFGAGRTRYTTRMGLEVGFKL